MEFFLRGRGIVRAGGEQAQRYDREQDFFVHEADFERIKCRRFRQKQVILG
jgi:hypothetical protein